MEEIAGKADNVILDAEPGRSKETVQARYRGNNPARAAGMPAIHRTGVDAEIIIQALAVMLHDLYIAAKRLLLHVARM